MTISKYRAGYCNILIDAKSLRNSTETFRHRRKSDTVDRMNTLEVACSHAGVTPRELFMKYPTSSRRFGFL